MDFNKLYEEAKSVINPKKLSSTAESGGVVAAMITAGENKIAQIIAVDWDGRIMPPCGRCREFLSQLADENLEAEVKINETTIVRLRELLPYGGRT